MPVLSAPEDKPKILFYGAMMAIQNYGFYQAYYPLYSQIPSFAGSTDCGTLRFWVGFFALDCFIESFCCLWMAMGGYVSSNFWFAFGWILHLIVALPYCVSTVAIPIAMYTDEGKVCRKAMGPAEDVLSVVYWVHCTLFMCYVWMMLSITYYSFLKPTFITKATKTSPAAFVEVR